MSLSRVNVLPWLGFCLVVTTSPVAHATQMLGAPGAEDHLINYLVLSGLSTSAEFVASVLYFYFSAPSQQTIGEVWDQICDHIFAEQALPLKKHRHHHHHHHHHHKRKSVTILPRADTAHSSLSEDPPPPPLANSPRNHGKHT